MVLLAFSLQDQVEKYGAYVGLAAFFGLAVLTLLYFAQAREVKRLREWAGRAPERAAELEQAVAAHAEEVRRTTPVPAPQPAPVPAPLPEPVAAPVNGAVKLKPEEVAALAFARAAGVHSPHVPAPPHPVPAAAVAAAPQTQVASAAPPVEPAPAPAPVPATNGGAVPAPSTPAARRSEPALGGREPLPRRPNPPARRTPPPPPRRESNTRAVVLTAVIGVLVLAGAAFGASKLFGGSEDPGKPPVVATPTEEAGSSATPQPAAPTKATAKIGVYNGTTSTGLAATIRDMLVEEGYPANNLGVATAPPEQQRQASVVMYGTSARAAAQGVATALDIKDVQRIDDATKALAAKSKTAWDVVVIVGADKSS